MSSHMYNTYNAKMFYKDILEDKNQTLTLYENINDNNKITINISINENYYSLEFKKYDQDKRFLKYDFKIAYNFQELINDIFFTLTYIPKHGEIETKYYDEDFYDITRNIYESNENIIYSTNYVNVVDFDILSDLMEIDIYKYFIKKSYIKRPLF